MSCLRVVPGKEGRRVEGGFKEITSVFSLSVSLPLAIAKREVPAFVQKVSTDSHPRELFLRMKPELHFQFGVEIEAEISSFARRERAGRIESIFLRRPYS